MQIVDWGLGQAKKECNVGKIEAAARALGGPDQTGISGLAEPAIRNSTWWIKKA